MGPLNDDLDFDLGVNFRGYFNSKSSFLKWKPLFLTLGNRKSREFYVQICGYLKGQNEL